MFLSLYLGFIVPAFKTKLNLTWVLFVLTNVVSFLLANSLGPNLYCGSAIAVFRSSINYYIILLGSEDLLGSPRNVI